jgi:Zn-dependent alcohol dehydrogenase
MRLRSDLVALVEHALDGTLDLAGMVTRVAPLGDWRGALDALAAGDVIRTVLTP